MDGSFNWDAPQGEPEDWGGQPQQDTSWGDHSLQSSSDWGSTSDTSNKDTSWGSPMSHDTSWGSPTQSNDTWGSPQDISSMWGEPAVPQTNSEVNIWGGEGGGVVTPDQPSPSQNTEQKPLFNLGYKQTALVLCGVLFVIFVIFLVLSKAKVTPKTQPTKTQTSSTSTQQTTVNNTSTSLMLLDDSVLIDYGGSTYTATGTVTSKNKYLQGTQVIYCIEINIQMGASSQLVKHYCNYNVFNTVTVNQLLTVNYQQVSDTCISVNSVTF